MPIEQKILHDALSEAFPNSIIRIEDMVGDNDHYELYIKSDKFSGLTILAQHKLVYAALRKYLDNDLHAIKLKTEA